MHLGEAIGRCYPKKQNEVYADLDTSICAEYYILNLELLISGRIQNGEEEQEPEAFDKNALLFPSGEALPKCWFDSDYKLKQAN